MGIVFEERASDSPYIDNIAHGYTTATGSTIRPAECCWHLVLVKHQGQRHAYMVGPWKAAGVVNYGAGAEIVWVRFKLGAFMPHLPTRRWVDSETALPSGGGQSFWLYGSTWQFPDIEHIDTFVERLARQTVLIEDPIVRAVLDGQPPQVAPRTVRHRFLQSTGLTYTHIRQVERAKFAAGLLAQGWSILDTVHEADYFDQPHLTRSLKHWIGYTPAELSRHYQATLCHSVQDPIAEVE